jgi:hypothetical protein
MASQIVLRRLRASLEALKAGHSGDVDVSSASIGLDRELFINLVLSNIISVPFRLGTGDIVDHDDKLSRQSDIVIEYANTLSFPNIYPSAARLYLADSVCAVVEVKSTISQQWALSAMHRGEQRFFDRYRSKYRRYGRQCAIVLFSLPTPIMSHRCNGPYRRQSAHVPGRIHVGQSQSKAPARHGDPTSRAKCSLPQ